MRVIDYKHEIVQQGVTFQPNSAILETVRNSSNRIFEIKASNGYGKTFLLDLLAYAMGLHLKSEINLHENSKTLDQLKERIRRYDDIDSYRLSYEIELPINENNSLKLSKNEFETSDQSSIELDNKPYAVDNLYEKLNVLYDIPTSPTKRLDSIVKDLIDWNLELFQKSERLFNKFSEIARRVKEVRDDEKIARLKKLISEYEKTRGVLFKRIELLERYEQLAFKKELLLEYIEAQTNFSLLKKSLHECKEEIQLLGGESKIAPYKNEKKINDLRTKTNGTQREWFNHCRGLANLLGKNEELVKEITKSKGLQPIYSSLCDPKIPIDRELFENDIKRFVDSIQDKILEIESRSDNQVYNILSTIKEQLESLENLNRKDIVEQIAGFDFIELKESLDRVLIKVHITDFSPIKRHLVVFISNCKQILTKDQKLWNELRKEQEKQQRSKNDILIEELIRKKSSLTSQVDVSEKRLRKLVNDLTGYDVFVENVKTEELNRLFASISAQMGDYGSFSRKEISLKISNERDKGKKLEDEINLAKYKIETENNKEKNAYSDSQKEKIDFLRRQTSLMRRNISAFSDLLKRDVDSNKSLSKEDSRFMDLIGQQIAKTMGSKLLLSDQKYVNLISYDLLKQEFLISDNKVIKRDDLSTGLASANYLKQRIRNLTGEYIVILLDEIGNMDPDTLTEVIQEIKHIESQGKLLLALLTQPMKGGVEVIEY